MVVVTQDAIPEPLQRPPVSWFLSTLLILKVGEGVEATTLLTTPLAERTPALALLYLTEEEEEDENKVLRRMITAMTWLPYSPEGPSLLSLGPWDVSAFPSFHSLFPERFKTLGGAEIGVASDNADAPLVFTNSEGDFDGTSVRLLEAVAQTMNFTFTLTEQAPDSECGSSSVSNNSSIDTRSPQNGQIVLKITFPLSHSPHLHQTCGENWRTARGWGCWGRCTVETNNSPSTTSPSRRRGRNTLISPSLT